MARVAFIGLGNMGGGMAANLARAGHEVRAFDLAGPALERATGRGCIAAASAAAAAEGAEAVISMLPSGAHVAQVYHDSLFGRVPGSAILIDCSTIDVATARALSAEAAAAGLEMVDAPVSGGIAAAEAGGLTFMVGGSAAGFERARPLLEGMGKAVIHAGPAGSGQAAKICNNMLLAATMAATCEAFLLAQKLGLDPRIFFDIASKSSGQSWSMTSYCPLPGVGPETPADHDYEGGFSATLMLKDLKLAMEASAAADSYVPMGSQAEQLYQRFVDRGGGAKDFSAIIKMIGDKWVAPGEAD